ncbi:YqhV family protein [Halothermothrix orenii]|uniref:DUF2619 domain-containing protein n=1 Tax=Halothermothrix orenii (strain H 168 / OCM 544 / DSM 9562) TaxID=373903 RepID=B8CY68_HALOH|nr:YqhV family protein [Halothermothrix orenii]ACL70237.1 hypothetical protein Hore_14880 [Halothermothrix orenii H 168]
MLKMRNILLAMIMLRLLSATIELSAAYMMHYFNDIKTAIRINAILGLVGPMILILVTFLGLVGIRSEVNFKNLILILLGVTLILLGTR